MEDENNGILRVAMYQGNSLSVSIFISKLSTFQSGMDLF